MVNECLTSNTFESAVLPHSQRAARICSIPDKRGLNFLPENISCTGSSLSPSRGDGALGLEVHWCPTAVTVEFFGAGIPVSTQLAGGSPEETEISSTQRCHVSYRSSADLGVTEIVYMHRCIYMCAYIYLCFIQKKILNIQHFNYLSYANPVETVSRTKPASALEAVS